MKKIFLPILQISLFLVIAGCGSSGDTVENDDILRAGFKTPERFNPPSGIVLDEESCKSPMIDPRSGISLTMVRSEEDYADYEVPNMNYGVERGELLRLDCSTGEVIGIVKK